MQVDYYYTPVSPWSYMAHGRFLEIADRHGASVNFMPVSFMTIFAASGGKPLHERPLVRQAYRNQEMKRWKEFLGVELTLEPAFFPANDTDASHLLIAARENGLDVGALTGAMMRAVWVEDRNLADADTLKDIVAAAGMDHDALQKWVADHDAAGIRTADTQKALDSGVFGAPTFVIGDDVYWGQDRLDFVDRRLAAG